MPTKKTEAVEEVQEVETLDEYEVLYETTIGSFFFDEGDIVRVPHGTEMNNSNLRKKGEVNKPKAKESMYFDPTTV